MKKKMKGMSHLAAETKDDCILYTTETQEVTTRPHQGT